MNALIVEDNQETRLRIVADLEHSGLFSHIYEAVDGLEGFRIVSERAPDLILCDVEMPRMDGLKFLNLLHTKPDTCHIPVLMLTGVVNRSVKLRGLTEWGRRFCPDTVRPTGIDCQSKTASGHQTPGR